MSTNGVSVPPERVRAAEAVAAVLAPGRRVALTTHVNADGDGVGSEVALWHLLTADRKSTRLNSSHDQISYAVFCLKKKNTQQLPLRVYIRRRRDIRWQQR